MPEYRYAGVDLLTRRVVEDLPLYGVSLERRISGAGNMTGSFKLGTGLFSDEDLLAASEPGRIALIAYRDNVIIWGGPIWSRTYQSQAQVCSLTGQSYESIFSAVKMREDYVRTGIDQLTGFRELIEQMQSHQNLDFGLETDKIGFSGVLRDIAAHWYDDQMYSKPIGDLLKEEDAFDYTIEPYLDVNEDIRLNVRTGYPYLGYGQSAVTFDYPGQIINYYYPESGGKAGVRFTLLGRGEGTAMKRAVVVDQPKIDAGYPAFDKIASNKGIDDQNRLNSMAAAGAIQYRMPVVSPTIDIKLTPDIEFGEWANLGVPILATIEDPRFPEQKEINGRMIGWDLSPQSSESADVIKLVLEEVE